MNTSRRSTLAALLWGLMLILIAAAMVQGIGSSGEDVHGFAALNRGVLAGSDTLSHDYPAAWWGWMQIRESGNLPLWNPSWFCGEPFLASQTFMPFYPPAWLSRLFFFPYAFNLQYPLHLVLASLVMGWACRRRGLSPVAAALAGLSWGFGGHLATLAGPGHLQKLQALTWLPLVTLGAARLAGPNPRRGVAPLGLGLALQVTAGHLQIVYFSLAAGALEAACVVLRMGFSFRLRRRLFSPGRVALGAAAALLALGLSSVFWVPTVEFAQLSNRQGDLSWEDNTRGSLPPEEAAEFALPRLLGDSMPHGRSGYIGRYGESSTSSPERVISDYVGAGVLIFALIGLFFTRGRRRWTAWGYLLLAVVALTLSMGKYLPDLYRLALRIVPGLAHFRSPSTMMALLAYGLIGCAGLGLDHFFRRQSATLSAACKRRWRLGALAGLVLALAAGLMLFKGRVEADALVDAVAASRKEAGQVSQELFASMARAMAWSHLLRGATLVLAILSLFAALRAFGKGRLTRIASAVLIALLTLAWSFDLVTNARDFWNAADVEPYEQFLLNHWAMPLWQKADQPVRYLEVGNELSNRALTLSDFESHLLIGYAHGYHPVAYKKYFDLGDRLGFTHPNFLRLFGVGYLILPGDYEDVPPEGFRHRADTPRGRLFFNPDIQYARAIRHIKVVESWDDVLDRLAEPGFNPYESTTVLAEDVSEKHWGKETIIEPINLNVRVIPLEAGVTRLLCDSRRKGFLAIAEPAIPGWRLTLDGQCADKLLTRTDGYFLGVLLPAGKHDLVLTYDPVSQRLGFYLTLLTLAIGAAWLGRRQALIRLRKKADPKQPTTS